MTVSLALLALPAVLWAQEPNAVRIDGYLQPRLEATADSAVFRFNHVRVGITGRASPVVTFRALVELLSGGGAAGGTATVSAMDAYVQIAQGPWILLAGQHKSPFVREFIINPPDLELPDLPVVVEQLATNRDLGVRVEWRRTGRVLLQGGVYNGEGRNRPRNDDGRVLLVGRGVVTVDSGIELGAAVTSHNEDMRWGLEAALRRGRVEARAEYVARDVAGVDAAGWFVLLGWMARPDRVQLLARLEQYDPNGATAGNRVNGFTGAVQWLFQGESLKLQAAYTFVDEEAGDVANNRLVIQGQVRF